MSEENITWVASPGKLAILSIATNKYLDFYKDLIKSYAGSCDHNLNIEFHLFTDQIGQAKEIKNQYPWLEIFFHEIAPLVWPEATLLRYQIYLEKIDEISSDYFMHIDADMLFLNDIGLDLQKLLIPNSMSLIAHPGFYRNSGLSHIKFALKDPIKEMKDLAKRFIFGGLGAWETNKKSNAFVSRRNRKNYFCGGVWIGSSKSFKHFLTINSQNTKNDLANGYIAIWHDESHLNKWASENKFTTLGPEYCYDPTYTQLAGIQGKIEAVDKKLYKKTI